MLMMIMMKERKKARPSKETRNSISLNNNLPDVGRLVQDSAATMPLFVSFKPRFA